jgi:peptidoglycan/xylan/chitin deacetylase (PgdA/CDA1 family)
MATQIAVISICILVLLPAYIVYKPPKPVISFFQSRFPDVLFQISTKQKSVGLTIDDAPSQHTREILEVLEHHNVTATFFVIGNQVPGREDILVDIIRAGHELGNHAMHDEPSVSLPSSTLVAEINSVDELINTAYVQANITRSSHLFRPGSGVFSRRVLDVAASTGYKTVLGSIYPHDPFIKYWRVNAWHILGMIRPGAVIICHDRRSWTAPMLRRALPEMVQRGYAITSVSGLLDASRA